jgi:hypothetical protein
MGPDSDRVSVVGMFAMASCLTVETKMLHGRLPANAPEWMTDPRVTPCVCVYADDLVEPSDGPPDQCAY